MVLIALYIAVGSGMPSLRAHFEMNELEFFNAWPLKLLMGLLVLNLSVVTWNRIPLTPPRYGVWCVHIGIITLVFGTSLYYRHKVEGLTLIPVSKTVGHFYDSGERALYFRWNNITLEPHPLPSLPRFNTYSAELGNADYLLAGDLRGIVPSYIHGMDQETGKAVLRPLASELGLSDGLKVDVLEYYPYATISTRFIDDPTVNNTGLRLTRSDPHTGREVSEWLVGSDRNAAWIPVGQVELEHRHAANEIERYALQHAATQFHRLDVKLHDYADTLYVEPGQTYTLGETGYTLSIEEFNPSWPMFGTNKIVPALTMRVRSQSPAVQREFKRMVLGGEAVQTDFLLNVPGAPPMGQRQKEPIDKDLAILYTFNQDSHRLLPREGVEKRTLVTAADGSMIQIITGPRRGSKIQPIQSGEEIEIELENAATRVRIERHDHLKQSQSIDEVPKAKRRNDAGQAGTFQVLRVRVSMGGWSQELAVPYAQFTADSAWEEASAGIPGVAGKLQLQLGNTQIPMPAKITLENFELVHYPGGSGSSGIRDFKSTLRIEDADTGEKSTGMAHMNNPVYFDDGRWLFFQAQWDPNGQRWTVLGVGNRPGVYIMLAGCAMIAAGLIYAFYIKPIIIGRMKQKALAKAAAGKMPKKQEMPELVPSR